MISAMAGVSDQSSVLSFEEARRVVEEHAARVALPATEQLDLLAASGRVNAQPLLADRDIPPFPRSTRDGYALQAASLSQIPAALHVIGEIKAGQKPDRLPSHVDSGQAVSIMTGAPVPTGADAVVMVEYTSRQGDRVEVMKQVASGENIVPRGAEARQGARLLDRGVRMDEAGIALAASIGKSKLEVYRRPRVAVLTTGDEIVGITETPGPTQIRNSNSYSLAAQILRAGAQPVLLPIAQDDPEELRRLIDEALAFDLLMMTGGVSMGQYDLVEAVLTEMSAEFFFAGAKIQPGRPVVFGRCGAGASARVRPTYFFGLPGNPVSTMVTFELFAKVMVEALSGQKPRKLTFLHATLKTQIRFKPGLRRFLPAVLSGEFEDSQVELLPWQGSGDIATTARANCYAVIPPNREHIAAGERISVMMR